MVYKRKSSLGFNINKIIKNTLLYTFLVFSLVNAFGTIAFAVPADPNTGAACDTSKYVFDNGSKYIVNCNLGRFTAKTQIGYYASDAEPLKYEIVIDNRAKIGNGSKDQKAVINEYPVTVKGAASCPPSISYGPVCTPSAGTPERTSNTPISTTKITVNKDVKNDNIAGLVTFQYDNKKDADGKNNVEDYYLISSDGTIILSRDGSSKTYKLDTSTAGVAGSTYSLIVNNTDKYKGTLTTVTCSAPTPNPSGYGTTPGSCSDPKTEDVIITKDDNTKTTRQTAAGGASSGSEKTLTDQCYDALPIFGYLFCGIIDLADSLYGVARQWIFDLLYIPEAAYSPSDCSQGCLKNSWNVSKNLANIGLVLVAMVMIASQIFSFEFMSAYTIKKIIPRLIAAAILIQLSWFIFTAMIQIMNAVGFGLYSLLTNAFGATDIINMLGQTKTVGEVTVTIASSLAVLGGVAALGISLVSGGASLAIVFSMLGVIVSIFIAIVTLVVRKMLIVILLAIAPLAILAWILPGTQNLWKIWWKLYSRLLAMLPLIALLFAAGAISAKMILTANEDPTFGMVAGIIAYFAPLFLITATFKFAGGLFSAIQGVLSKSGDKTRGFGWFGGKDLAKLNKENSAYALNKKAREADRIAQKQKGYSETLLDKKGFTGKYLNRRGIGGGMYGVSDTGLSDVLARAAASRSQEEKQQQDNARTRGYYEIERLRGSADKDGLYDDIDMKGHKTGKKIGKKQANQNAAARLLLAAQTAKYDEKGNATITVDGRAISTSRDAISYVAAAALENKAEQKEVYDYVHSQAGSAALIALGQNDDSVQATLLKRAPSLGKGAIGQASHITSSGSVGYDLALSTYVNIGYEDERKGILNALRADLVGSDVAKRSKASADLAKLVRNGQLEDKHWKELRTVGFDPTLVNDLTKLQADPNARVEYDATAGKVVVK